MSLGILLPAGLAIVLAGSAALADGAREPSKDVERPRLVDLARDEGLSRRPVRVHRRYHEPRDRYGYHRHHAYAYRPWDGRYRTNPRRHFFVSGIHYFGLHSAMNVAAVSYRTYVYYTPSYPSVAYGYPPYARLHDLTHGPLYNKPCFC